MSPSEVKRYLQARGFVPMVDLVNRFDCDAEAMRGVLDFWIRKGRVRRMEAGDGECATGASCGGCAGGCAAPALGAVYAWVEAGESPLRTIRAVSAAPSSAN